jgi:hypothetical protein
MSVNKYFNQSNFYFDTEKLRCLPEVDPESRNCGSSHFKRPYIRDETEFNTL